MNPLISFVVPIYNIDDNLLSRCIESLISQQSDKLPIEIILVDDGSTKTNGEICDSFAVRYPFIMVIHSSNKGVSVARNIGIDNSSGDYICFVDPDDRLMEKYIQKPYSICREKKADVVVFTAVSSIELSKGFSGDNSLKANMISDKEFQVICKQVISIAGDKFNYGACWGKLIKRSFIHDNNLKFIPGLRKAQDRVFMFDLYQKKPNTYSYDDVGYIYTIFNPTSICNKYNPNIINILEETQKQFELRNHNGEFTDAINSMNMMFFSEYMNLMFANNNNPDSKNIRIKKLKDLLKREPYITALKEVRLNSVRKKCTLMVILLRLKLYYFAISINYN